MDYLHCSEVVDHRLVVANPAGRRNARNLNASAVEWVGNGALDRCFLGCAVYGVEQPDYSGLLDSSDMASWFSWVRGAGSDDVVLSFLEVIYATQDLCSC